MIDLHMLMFNGLTFGMSVEASSPEFRRMKRNAFTMKIAPRQTVRCVQAADVAAVMGQAGWLVSERQEMQTIRWGNDATVYYIIYDENTESTDCP